MKKAIQEEIETLYQEIVIYSSFSDCMELFPNNVVEYRNVRIFAGELDKFWCNQEILLSMNIELIR